jgi:hypothetical protein
MNTNFFPNYSFLRYVKKFSLIKIFKAAFHYVAEAGLKLKIFLPQPPKS